MAEKDNKPVQDAVVLVAETDDELSQTIDVEKLGRQRPAAFSSAWMEIAFVVSILGSLSMAVGTSIINKCGQDKSHSSVHGELCTCLAIFCSPIRYVQKS
jgi:hypothetical protein